MGLVKDLWSKAQALIEEKKREKQLKNLRLQGELELRQMELDYENSVDRLEKAIIDERDKDRPDYKQLVRAHEEVKISKQKFEIAKEMFEDLFGEKPSFVE